MTVEAIRLQNFMAFEDTGWIELRPITLLFGRNSSGKSAIIRALRLLKQSLDAPGDKGPFIFESLYGVDLGSFTDMVHGGSDKKHVWFHFRCASSDIADSLTALDLPALEGNLFGKTLQLSLGYAAHRQEHANLDPTRVELVDLQIRLGVDGPSAAPLLFHAALLEPEDASLLGEDWYVQGLLTQGAEANSWRGFGCRLDRGFLPDLVPPSYALSCFSSLNNLVNVLKEDVTAFLRGIIHLGPIRPEPERRYSFDRVKAFEWRERGWGAFLEFINGRLPHIQSEVNASLSQLGLAQRVEPHASSQMGAFVTEFEIGVTELGVTRPLPLSAQGFGISQVLPIVVQSLSVDPMAIVLIEQPELHLHTEAQATLADFFVQRVLDSLILKNNVRWLLETHSEHLLLRLQRRIAQTSLMKLWSPQFQTLGDASLFNEGNDLLPESLALFYLSRQAGNSVAEHILFDSHGELIQPSSEFRDFFKQDYDDVVGFEQAIANIRRLSLPS